MHTDSCLFFDLVFVHFLLASIYINVEVEIVSVHVSIIKYLWSTRSCLISNYVLSKIKSNCELV